jgi:ribosomal protein S18 acetylase RimI-like enzyme
MQIKTITRDNIGIIKSLWEDLNAHHLSHSTNFTHHFSKLRFEDRVEALKKRDQFIAYVAESGHESVGYCIATVHDRAGEIDSLFLSAAYRGKGYGKALMDLALNWLNDQNCETIRVSIAEGNEEALDFYRRFGFAERFVVMQKK